MPLVLIPTPLGNLRDITLRALDVLAETTLIVAENPGTTRRLLSAHSVQAPEIWTYPLHASPTAIAGIIERAQTETVVIMSDAGMPGVSDPGADLVAAARSAAISVEVLPGPVAFIGAAVLSGFSTDGLVFHGFISRTEARRRAAFREALASGLVSAWYESPHRIEATLATLAAIAPETSVFVLREYTKKFEQQIRGTPAEVDRALERPVRGEFVLILDRGAEATPPDSEVELTPETAVALDEAIDQALADGLSGPAAAKKLATAGFGDRSMVYRRIVERGKPEDDG